MLRAIQVTILTDDELLNDEAFFQSQIEDAFPNRVIDVSFRDLTKSERQAVKDNSLSIEPDIEDDEDL